MALSKPRDIIFELVGAYFNRLYTSPVRTKAVTSCVFATLGNLISQKLSGAKYLNQDSLVAFALFGLLIGGPVPHYFYMYAQRYLKHPMGLLLVERLLYTPGFLALALYMLARFEGKSHEASRDQLKKLYWPTLTANLKYLTLLQYINIRFVPPVLRVLFVNMVGLFWSVYLANQRAKLAKDKSARN
ncbi:peroxisomal membrane protein 2 [Belonocnema kinseyi]|uniref:peroxisomal membrane protein 2 n=1 Tax=Belonocnema kinseyi TaxID=2817044 RepID=UPI00143DD571|nr:peroxisomal membrane protein 2 [Belonocnema kinseyi]